MTLQTAALGLAVDGFRVHPLRPRTKLPMVSDWPTLATSDPDTIAEWWMRWPDANVGVATGRGLVVLDVDGPEGVRSVGKLTGEHGMMPHTLTAKTGSGGWHLYYATDAPISTSAGVLAPNVDVRGEGGQVVAPPSVHPNGNEYTWARHVPIAKLPSWIAGLLRDNASVRQSVAPVDRIIIHAGARNATLISMAGSMRRAGFEEDAILAAIRLVNCEPPVEESDLRQIARSAAKYERGTPASKVLGGSVDSVASILAQYGE